MPEKIISMKNIRKEFSGVPVLKDVDFNIYDGKIMALIGENGAGKSTLMKILTGVYAKTSGEIIMNGKEVNFTSTKDSQDNQIAIIHQELNLIQHLSISENIFLGREPITKRKNIKWSQLYAESKKWLDKLGLNEDPRELVKNVSVGKQQLVEIAKALSLNAKVIIMDEPTGALTVSETEKLFSVIKELKQQGHSIVYISHRLKEIFELCDDVTVLRDGELIGEKSIDELDEDKIIEMMVGRKLSDQYPRISFEAGNVVLEVKGLTNQFVKDVSFELHHGEILGIAGLMGAGRTELARTLYGIYTKNKGTILLNKKEIRLREPADALKQGIAYVSEDRKANGIVLGLSVRENITLASLKRYSGKVGNILKKKEEETTQKYMRSMSIKTSSSKQLLKYLSGGNQQKVSIAKNLDSNPKILILDEPTRGVDVGAKKEIYELINQFKQEGMSIIMISSEIPEILGMSDRILVMHEGKVMGTLNRDEATQEKIMSLAVGKEVG
ncbi:sugar ABC transporter ATP-binding protein [Clostridium aminobutyricum]|uniref:ATP-binding cassette domain-containing protein n=1 Tax=Clostridium aminobutyricum TaxID=33953 RepID=A0A939IIW6_CLOAM|nr:ATP-binding cassette domain-containing protein [Clostridium aminobutyricum]MBN7772949.1 ATP-binding cassette domain-containing protein [Clostridium aminobutyricum]